MSLLNPVLLPPKVKAYLIRGERFIKWDDVSGAGAVGCWCARITGGQAVIGFAWVSGLVSVYQDQVPV